MTVGMVVSLLIGAGVGFLVGFLVWSSTRKQAPKSAEVHEEDVDPYLIGAIALSRRERALLGDMAPDPDKEIMTVRFTLSDAGVDLNTGSMVPYPACGVPWTVHADGRLSPKSGPASGVTQTLVLDDGFIAEAQMYASQWPPRPHANPPPHIYASGGAMYRLVWYKRNWYLEGADDEYRARVMYIQSLMAKVCVEDWVDRYTST